MAEGGEVAKGQLSTSDSIKPKPVDLNAVADLAQQRGHTEVAKNLRNIAQQPTGTSVNREQLSTNQ